MLFSMPFPILLTMLAIVSPTLASPLGLAIGNTRVPSNWKRSKETDLPELRSRMSNLIEDQQKYELGPGNEATLAELKIHSLQAINLLEKCIQLYGTRLIWVAHRVWLQERADDILKAYHNKVEEIASQDAFRYANSNRDGDLSFNRLLFWEIVGKKGVIAEASLEERELIARIQERTFSRFKQTVGQKLASNLISLEQSHVFQFYLDYFHSKRYKADLDLPASFNWNFPDDALIRDNRQLPMEEVVRGLQHRVAIAVQRRNSGRDFKETTWQGMIECDDFIYRREGYRHTNMFKSVSSTYMLLMRVWIPDQLGTVAFASTTMKAWAQNIPKDLPTALFRFEVYRLLFWNAAIKAHGISIQDCTGNKKLQKLLETASEATSIESLLYKWNDTQNPSFIEIEGALEELRRHLGSVKSGMSSWAF